MAEKNSFFDQDKSDDLVLEFSSFRTGGLPADPVTVSIRGNDHTDTQIPHGKGPRCHRRNAPWKGGRGRR